MSLKKVLRYAGLAALTLTGLVIILVVTSVGTIDRTPANQLDAYVQLQSNLDAVDSVQIRKARRQISVGWAKVNITPDFPTATAGYGNRKGKLISGIRDSIFARAVVISNGTNKVAMVSADLLIVPPLVRERLRWKLTTVGFSLDNTYLGASHTHNSIGNWAEGLTQFMYGKYDDRIVELIASKIIDAIRAASASQEPATIKTGAIPMGNVVQNRLIPGGPEDSLMRVVEVRRSDSSKMMLMSFTAHATCLYSKDMELSRDYPGKLVDEVEASGYDFAIFFAGAVGSHKPSPPVFGGECIDWMAREITTSINKGLNLLHPVTDSTIAMLRVPLPLSDPQFKIDNRFKVRSWFFKAAMGEFPADLVCLRIGTILFYGTPCDFSGEFNPSLDAFALSKGYSCMVTSFNGGYIGYLTPSIRYDVNNYETRLMNWYAPGTGEEVEEALQKIGQIITKK